MPLRRRVVVATASTASLLFAGACASAPGTPATQLGAIPAASAGTTHLTAAQRDSVFAQALAEQEGPRVSVSAEFANVSVGSRRVRAHVHLDDDAYVVVGQITPDGVVRIVFPEDPSDDGFLKGHANYQTAEFFAGFDDQYRYRLAESPFGRFGAASRDSYDAGFGFMFVVASWRPMRFDRFSTGGAWDSFELVGDEYIRDPRPAVYELAALLAGPNREAYSVEFAHYTTTRYAFDGSSFGGLASYGYGFCSGWSPLGFASSPFSSLSLFNSALPYGESFYYRGQFYAYNAFGDCYTTQSGYSRYGYGYGYPGGYIVSQAPPIHPRRTGFDLGARNPITPQPPRARIAVGTGQATDAGSTGAKVSPVYRTRGLLTSDTPDPRRASGSEPVRTRPTIQDMLGRHFEGREGVTRAQVAGDESASRSSRNQPRVETPTRGRESGNSDSPRGAFTRPTSSDAPRVSPRSESPRVESPRVESPRSESPRVSAPPPRSEAPRSEAPRVERSSPPPAPAPRSDPPARPPESKKPAR